MAAAEHPATQSDPIARGVATAIVAATAPALDNPPLISARNYSPGRLIVNAVATEAYTLLFIF
jgi:hypothetical protein